MCADLFPSVRRAGVLHKLDVHKNEQIKQSSAETRAAHEENGVGDGSSAMDVQVRTTHVDVARVVRRWTSVGSSARPRERPSSWPTSPPTWTRRNGRGAG